MEIPVIAALLLHVIWLARSYQHAKPEMMQRVRTASALSSLILTTWLFCLIYSRVSDLADLNFKFSAQPGGREVVRVISSPDNSVCYAEIGTFDDFLK
ncbi:hypothetical protein GZ982_30275 (plasmid) [Pseudomonas fluorescens]|nr:hypothetical protein GZ982_30275 [Pseudomonas fluorescens]